MKRGLQPMAKLNLECLKPKYYNYQMIVDCKLYIKGIKCQTYRKKKIIVLFADLNKSMMLV